LLAYNFLPCDLLNIYGRADYQFQRTIEVHL